MDADIGVIDEAANKAWSLESRFFPHKVGGKVAWLDLKGIPDTQDTMCSICGKPVVFILQLYCPVDTSPVTFHRTLFLFACLNPSCFSPNSARNFIVYRCQLPRVNCFYPKDPPQENPDWHPEISCEKFGIIQCSVCGLKASDICSKCTQSFCSILHHKCEKNEESVACHTLPQFGVKILESEAYEDSCSSISDADSEDEHSSEETARIMEYEKIVSETPGCFQDDPTLEQYVKGFECERINDEHFVKFKKTIAAAPHQVVRYVKGQEPLWITRFHIPDEKNDIPACEHCRAPRVLEFQVLPQLLHYLKLDADGKYGAGILDWGILTVYTCKESCNQGPPYKKEFLWKQDPA